MKTVKEQVKAIIDDALDRGVMGWAVLEAVISAVAESPKTTESGGHIKRLDDGRLASFQILSKERDDRIKMFKEAFKEVDDNVRH